MGKKKTSSQGINNKGKDKKSQEVITKEEEEVDDSQLEIEESPLDSEEDEKNDLDDDEEDGQDVDSDEDEQDDWYTPEERQELDTYTIEKETFCRNCSKTFLESHGDALLQLCENCIELFDINKIRDDFIQGSIKEDSLPELDLKKYQKG